MNTQANISEAERGMGRKEKGRERVFHLKKSDNSSYKMLVSKLNTLGKIAKVISNVNTYTYPFIQPTSFYHGMPNVVFLQVFDAGIQF